VPATRCQPARTRFTSRGLGRVVVGTSNEALLRSAGQPAARGARVWRWCVQQREGRKGRIRAVLDPEGQGALVVSTYPEHEARGIGTGDRLRSRRSLVRRGRFVYGVRNGRVRFVATVTGALAKRPARVRSYLRLAGLR